MRPPLRVQKPMAVILGSVPGRLDPNSVSVLTRYLYRCLTIKTNLVEVDGNAPRALTSTPSGTVLQTAVRGNFLIVILILNLAVWFYPIIQYGYHYTTV